MEDSRLFFWVGIDCEPLAARSPQCGGPASWEVSERTICAFAEIAREKDLVSGFAFHATPEAARAHSRLLGDLHREGFDLGIQPNVPGFRYPTYDRDLGRYSPEEQREILRLATADWQQALGLATTSYTPCCGSMSDDTPSLLVELGYRQLRHACSGRFDPHRPDRTTYGMYPFPHHAHPHSKLLNGDLDLYVLPNTGHPDLVDARGGHTGFPTDLRTERPPTEETRASYREIIVKSIERMIGCGAPVKLLSIGTHNTEYVHLENMRFLCDAAREAAGRFGLTLTPASLEAIHREADALGAF